MRVILLALLVTTLAGCTSEAPAQATDTDVVFSDYELEATDETGILRGVVVDAAIVPIPGATVRLAPGDLVRTTNEAGAFGFDGLEPGFYTIDVEKTGFVAAQQTAQVAAGDGAPPILKVRLMADPTNEPFVETFVFEGLIACSIRSPVIGVAACGVGPVATTTGNVFLQEYTFDRVAEHVQSEMVWKKTQATGDRMELSWDDLNGDNQVEIKDEAGASPVTVAWGRAEFEALNLTGKALSMRVFSADMEGTDVVDDDQYQNPYRDTAYDPINSTGAPGVIDTVSPQCAPVMEWPCTNNPLGESCIEYAALFDSCFAIGGAGVTADQGFSVYTNTFYNLVPDDGWTFVADGAYPLQ